MAGRVSLVAATVLFGLAVRPGAVGPALLALAGLVMTIVAAGRTRRRTLELDDETTFLAAVLSFAIVAAVAPMAGLFGPATPLVESIPAILWGLIAAGVYLMRSRWTKTLTTWTVATVMLITLVAGVASLAQVRGVGIDVLFLHTEAAEALLDLENPYTDAVSVVNGSPTAGPDDLIIGYPYPPVTLVGYSIGEWLFGDPRFTSLIAFTLTLGLLSWQATRATDRRLLLCVLLMAAMPGWPFVLRGSWTEPLSLMLMALLIPLWHRPISSGSVWGLALASKQYFVVTAPALLKGGDARWRTRALVAVGVTLATLSVPLVIDPSAFWDAAVAFHSTTPPRTDASNLVGLLAATGVAWDPPFWLGLVAGAITCTLLSLRARDAPGLLLAMIGGLGVSFFLSSQAFGNYWFLLAGMSILVAAPWREMGSTGT